jgi:hypothetical protein
MNPNPTSNFGPLDELIGILLETWGQRYTFNCDRKLRFAVFQRDKMQARVDELATGQLRVTYEHAPGQHTEEVCNVRDTAKLVEAILFRQQLCRLSNFGHSTAAGASKPWWKKILGL